jgi:hypothetical protein
MLIALGGIEKLDGQQGVLWSSKLIHCPDVGLIIHRIDIGYVSKYLFN